MEKERFIALVNKYLAGEASAAEEALLMLHYDQFQAQEGEWNEALMGEKMATKARLYRQVAEEIRSREGRRLQVPVRWMVAASVMLCLLAAVLYLYLAPPKNQPLAGTETKPRDMENPAAAPGTNKATLTLADGTMISLQEAAAGELAREAGNRITKTAEGRIVYQVSDATAAGRVSAYNTIETPRGGQYQVTLPDGTRVWLNAGTTLRYPARLAGPQRQVELSGEAYFEVAKNKALPFRVVSARQTVEVLGTHFNVSAYAEEAAAETTLLEGAVRVSLPAGASPQLLHPGQQARTNAAGTAIAVQSVEVEQAVAWKNGYFMFVDEDLQRIMRQLARWYDVEVVYAGAPPQLKFGGMISRSKSVIQALRILEATGNVHFQVEGRRITVRP